MKQELYLKNKPLIKKAIKDLHCKWRTEDEFQEYYDAGEIGLIKAINSYNKEKISSSSYFYSSIINEIKALFYHNSMQKRKINYMYKVSLDGDVAEDLSFADVIPDNNVHIEEDLLKYEQYLLLYKAIDMLKPDYKEIICNYFGIKRGKKSLETMSNESGTTRQAIAQKKDIALKQLRKIYLKLGGV